MAEAQKKPKIVKDEYAADGVRMFNPSLSHGVVYCDGFLEVKYIQEYEGRETHYRGDRMPVGYRPGEPLPKHADELLNENQQLRARIADLEISQKRTHELLERLSAQLAGKAMEAPAPIPAAAQAAAERSGPTSEQLHPPGKAQAPEASARGAPKTK
jgi:hypothetical protein